jgi:hypothetical protein
MNAGYGMRSPRAILSIELSTHAAVEQGRHIGKVVVTI